ncbi:MAG: hypothetical protein HY695_01365 [Deltaproteobacteria bacterium]|nr:hypothetical protein [Deltaproteobacteria bacterium]
MSRILAIRGTEGEREVDYSSLSLKEIEKRIETYESRFGSFTKMLKSYDCESSPPEDYLALIDWECLLHELKERKRPNLSLIKGSRKKPR